MTVALGTMMLPAGEDGDNSRRYLNGTLPDGGLWEALRRTSDHDHTGGILGKQISIAAIPDGSITVDKIDPSVFAPYALVDGSKPFTGPVTMEQDATVRDRLMFGEQGTALPPDVWWERAGVGRLRTDGSVGVGITPAAWDAAYAAIQLRGGLSLWSATGIGAYWSSNTYFTGDRHAVQAGAGTEIALGVPGEAGPFVFKTAPSVAAGDTQTFASRLTIDTPGTVSITPLENTRPLILHSAHAAAFNAGNSVLQMSRAVPASNHQWMHFQGGTTAGDFLIGRKVNSDNLCFSLWNGSIVDRMEIAAAIPVVSVGTSPGAWDGGYAAYQVGGTGAMVGAVGGEGLYIRSNSIVTGGVNRAMIAGAGIQLNMAAGNFLVYTCASVGATATQTPIERFRVQNDGFVGVNATGPAIGQAAFQVNGGRSVINLSAGAFTGGDWLYFRDNDTARTAYMGITSAGNTVIGLGQGHLLLSPPAGNFVGPGTHNAFSLGASGFNWTSVWATNGTIQTCSRDAKQERGSLDPEAALKAVLHTPIREFAYKTALERRQHGYYEDEADPLFMIGPGQATPSNDAAIVAAALQALCARLGVTV